MDSHYRQKRAKQLARYAGYAALGSAALLLQTCKQDIENRFDQARCEEFKQELYQAENIQPVIVAERNYQNASFSLSSVVYVPGHVITTPDVQAIGIRPMIQLITQEADQSDPKTYAFLDHDGDCQFDLFKGEFGDQDPQRLYEKSIDQVIDYARRF